MGILTNLNNGYKIRFEDTDDDIWGYNGDVLQQYINNTLTGFELSVIMVNEEIITIDWIDATSTLTENEFEWVAP
jgi:hypothetical protein